MSLIPSLSPFGRDPEPANLPKIRHRVTMRDVVSDADLVRADDPIREATRRMLDAEAALRAKIAIAYPPLPPGYVWAREIATSFEDFSGRISVRYVARRRDELGPGAAYFRP